MMRFTLRQRSRQERLVYFCTIWTSLGPFDEFEDWAKGLHLLCSLGNKRWGKRGYSCVFHEFSWHHFGSCWCQHSSWSTLKMLLDDHFSLQQQLRFEHDYLKGLLLRFWPKAPGDKGSLACNTVSSIASSPTNSNLIQNLP